MIFFQILSFVMMLVAMYLNKPFEPFLAAVFIIGAMFCLKDRKL